MNHKKYLSIFAFLLSGISFAYAQSGNGGNTEVDGRRGNNIISTAVPFLLVSPDARAGGMGEAGVATLPDGNSTHWNPSKLAFINNPYGFSVTYSPWMQKFVPDISMAYLNGYYRLDDRNVLGGSLRYFSYGDLQATDGQGNSMGSYRPNELAVDASLARSFGDNFSLGTAVRFIYSNLNGGISSGGQNIPGTAFAADVSGFYKSDKKSFLGKEATYSTGVNISNIGTKISYTDGGPQSFLPTNLKLGGALTYHADDLSDLTFTVDLNKLLVPTDPMSTKSVPAGIFGSFNDAPGGFSEEMKEINYAVGAEYWYNRQFAVRAGYFYENPDKGGRSYVTLGAGLKYNILNIDLSYVAANVRKSPMAQTLRFTLALNFAEVSSAIKGDSN